MDLVPKSCLSDQSKLGGNRPYLPRLLVASEEESIGMAFSERSPSIGPQYSFAGYGHPRKRATGP